MIAPAVEVALMVDWGEGSAPRYEYVPAQDVVHAAEMARHIYTGRPTRVVGREVQAWRLVHLTPAVKLGDEVAPFLGGATS